MRNVLLALPAAALLAGLVPTASLAEETRYIDDRSSAETLVQSFYNAVNRKEYARAWDYFGDEKPAADLATFAKGYENTTQVNVIAGNVASEGAAGSIFYYLPVSIAAFDKDGSEQVFAGCYTARIANPAIQEPPFRPLHITSGVLKPSNLSYDDALPEACPDAPAPEKGDEVLAQAKALFAASHGECDRQVPGADPAQAEVEQHRLPFNYMTDPEDQPQREARLFRFYCGTGAYNETHVYYQYDEDQGLRELQFARPELDIRYDNEQDQEKVRSITIMGYTTDTKLVNSSYDEASHSIVSATKWRGVGDASDSGTWMFRNGEFTLVKFDVDASYDGEINPETLIDFAETP